MIKRLMAARIVGALLVTTCTMVLTSCSAPSVSDEHPGIDAEAICSDAENFIDLVSAFNDTWMPEAVNADRELALSGAIDWSKAKSISGITSLQSFDYPLDSSQDSLAQLTISARDTVQSAGSELRSWLLIIDDTMALDHFLKFQSDRAKLQDIAVKFALACHL